LKAGGIKMNIFYGPVLSRRFGYSLGVDIIPYKICSYDCIYCQLGKTTKKTVERKSYIKFNTRVFEDSLLSVIDSNQRTDYITFSGSGEPTLNQDIGIMIREVKKMTDIPVAVLTNGSLLHRKDVVDDLLKADLIKVSVDAPDQKVLQKINRPHPDIMFADLSRGLESLLSRFRGKVWLEIMLVKGINDSLDTACEYEAFFNNLQNISNVSPIESIHLNTPVRPTEKSGLLIPDHKRLQQIKKIIGSRAEIIKGLDIGTAEKVEKLLGNDIIELVRRRPVTAPDISRSLQVNLNEVIKSLKILIDQGKVKVREYNKKKYYQI
jgi:wyosine [tRNA(Phe)-imidazoG37] synthetase (radical SAM superfamily)